MAAFSGHREDGDELLEWRFRAAYSHVEERWWEKRGEDEFPLLSLWRRGSSNPPPRHHRLEKTVQGCPVILRRRIWAFEIWWNKMFKFHVLGWQGETLLLSTCPLSLSLHSTPTPLDLPFLKSFPCIRGKNAPPSSAAAHLLFIVCFLTFISNSFHWHMKSWQREDRPREGGCEAEERGFKSEAVKERKRGVIPFSLSVIAAWPHPVKLEQNRDRKKQSDNLDLCLQIITGC